MKYEKSWQKVLYIINRTKGTRYEEAHGADVRPLREKERAYFDTSIAPFITYAEIADVKAAIKACPSKALGKVLDAVRKVAVDAFSHYSDDAGLSHSTMAFFDIPEEAPQDATPDAVPESAPESVPQEAPQEVPQPQETMPQPQTVQETAPQDTTPQEAPQADGIIRHAVTDDVIACLRCHIPVYLYGEAGTGKTEIARAVAHDMGLELYTASKVQSVYDLSGFIDAKGEYQPTDFYRAFTMGGIFLLDELDASAPDAVIALNSAIANNFFTFPKNGRVTAHENFLVIATGNTTGCGADSTYTGRDTMDGATLDRFAFITVDYDRRIEEAIAKGDTALCDFIDSYRKACKELIIATPVTYRAIKTLKALTSAGMPKDKAIKIGLLKGTDKDTMKAVSQKLWRPVETAWVKAYEKAVRA